MKRLTRCARNLVNVGKALAKIQDRSVPVEVLIEVNRIKPLRT
jgi:hypothetical protein